MAKHQPKKIHERPFCLSGHNSDACQNVDCELLLKMSLAIMLEMRGLQVRYMDYRDTGRCPGYLSQEDVG